MASEAGVGYLFCSNCGSQNPEKNNFCSKCGMRIARGPAEPGAGVPCANCGYENDPSAAFCVRCSTPIHKDVILRELEDVVILTILKSQIDFENHRDFVAILNKLIKRRIVIDLGNVTWMDSTGIGMLVTFTYRTTRTKQEVKIVGMTPKVRDAVKALQVDNVLSVFPDVNTALADWGLPPI